MEPETLQGRKVVEAACLNKNTLEPWALGGIFTQNSYGTADKSNLGAKSASEESHANYWRSTGGEWKAHSAWTQVDLFSEPIS